MKKCDNCKKPVKTGKYFEVDDKILCMKCASPEHKKKFKKKEKPEIITCPYCEKEFDFKLRKCPNCKKWNPLFDFHAFEFFMNLLVGYLVFLVPVTFLLVILDPQIGTLTGFSLIIDVIFTLLFTTLIFAVLFYIGRWVRSKF